MEVVNSPGERFSDHNKDGLAVGKKKILQVNLKGKENPYPYVIFEYYTEYGDDGIVVVHTFERDGRYESEQPLQHTSWLPVEALLTFVDRFRKELESK